MNTNHQVLFHDKDNNVIASFNATQQEINALPLLMEAKEKYQNGDAMGAFESLIDVCKKTNTNVLKVIDNAKDNYNKEKELEKEQEEELEKTKHEPFLVTNGDVNILRDAFVDGSSKICPYCNALIALNRYKIHIEHWCVALKHEDEDE